MPDGSTLLALALFAFVTSITPGPNNFMLLASGLNFGLARTVPHMLGVALGFVLMVALVGLGVSGLFAALPWLHGVLRWVGTAYLLWLAWQLASAPVGGDGAAGAGARPMTFLGAAAFQWVNPKAWTMALTATATYADPERFLPSVLAIALVFGVVNLPSVAVWAGGGAALRGVLARPGARRVFNVAMAVLLVASLWPVVVQT